MAEEQKKSQQIDLAGLEENVPDRLHPVLEFVVENLKLIGAVIAAILIVVGAYAGWEAWSEHKVSTTQNELGKIVVQKRGAAKVEALEAFLKDAPEAVRPQATLELAKARMESGDYEGAAQTWTAFKEMDEPGMETVAELGRTKSLMLAGKNQEALEALKALKPTASKPYARLVDIQLASAAEAAGDWPTAYASYQALLSTEDTAGAAFIQAKLDELSKKI